MHPLSRESGIVMHTDQKMHQLHCHTGAAAVNAQMDPLTLVYERDPLLSMLFRETDRVQRMKTSLCLMLFAIENSGARNIQMSAEGCDDLLPQIAERALRILRSYDVLGRLDSGQFLAILPGCNAVDATMLAERLQVALFGKPFQSVGESIQLSACFGIASSEGRSPMVVLSEVQQALSHAKNRGPGSIACFGMGEPDQQPRSPFLTSVSKNEPLA
jgi:two-component system, cell cycle response regulator